MERKVAELIIESGCQMALPHSTRLVCQYIFIRPARATIVIALNDATCYHVSDIVLLDVRTITLFIKRIGNGTIRERLFH